MNTTKPKPKPAPKPKAKTKTKSKMNKIRRSVPKRYNAGVRNAANVAPKPRARTTERLALNNAVAKLKQAEAKLKANKMARAVKISR